MLQHVRVAGVVLSILLATLVSKSVLSDDGWRTSAGADWSIVGGDWANTRFSQLARINTQNVSTLRGAWMSQRFEGGTSRATPIVKDGVMFVTARSAIYALNAATGETKWRYGSGGSGRGGGQGQAAPSKEGVALGEGLVFAGLSDARVIALRQTTGEVAWNQYIGDTPPVRGQASVGAPTYANGLVFFGLNADRGFRGQAVALDAKTGRQVWKSFVVPDPMSPGHETWPKDNWPLLPSPRTCSRAANRSSKQRSA